MDKKLGFEVLLDLPYEDAVERVEEALKAEGFGVLTRIDVRATLQEKLGVSFRPYTILGACNPSLAHRALSAAPEVGLMLPCNVTVEEAGDGKSCVRFVNPAAMLQVGELEQYDSLREIAQEAGSRLEKAALTLAA